MQLEGGVFIVTGSATGLGSTVAQRLAGKGARVVINYTKSEAEAQTTAEECRKLGAEAILCQADVSVDEDCRRMAADAVERWGRIDGLVNNAAQSKIVPHADLEGLSSDDFMRIFAVNVVGPYQMVRAVTPHMKKQGKGAIVNVSSVSGFRRVGQFHCIRGFQGRAEHYDLVAGARPGPGDTGQRRMPRRDADPLVEGRPGGGELQRLHRTLRQLDPSENGRYHRSRGRPHHLAS